MVYRAVQNYYKFFDETLQSTTFIVLLITMLIFIVGALIPAANAQNIYLKGNILETQQSREKQNHVIIDGVMYEISFSKIQ